MDLEELMLSHLNPINALVHVLALIIAAYGLWTHELLLIALAIILGILGHVHVSLTGWKYKRKVPIVEAVSPTPAPPTIPEVKPPKVRKRKGKGVKVKIE